MRGKDIIIVILIILVFGLSMFDISLKEWFKHIWKFLLALLVVIIIILIILMVI